MGATRTTRIVWFALGAFTLTGCPLGRGYSASGWSFGYAQAGPDVRAAGPPRSVAIAVLDQRPYVLEGAKVDSFAGLSRDMFGIPYDVVTPKGAPLASDMASALLAAFRSKGFAAEVATSRPEDGPEAARQALSRTFASRMLLFTILQWRTDSNWTTRLDFDLSLEVLDGGGGRLATARVSGKETSDSSVRGGERDAQRWFAVKVAELLGDDAVAASFR
jgi:hypothetical protein